MNPPPSEQSGEIQRKEKTRWRLAAARAGMFVGDAEARKEARKHTRGCVEPKGVILPFFGGHTHTLRGGHVLVGRRGGVPGR